MKPKESEESIVPAPTPQVCSVCHQPTLPTYYFCPNCGTKLITAPLSTTVWTQFGIYLFSIILPFICFLFVTRWPGIKYFKSTDPKARMIGKVAWFLIVASTLFTFWYAYYITVKMLQSLSSSLNSTIGSGLGY